jgi:CO dehydrogenase maturation factor
MIIGFLGKGGSGKSTLSHLYTRYLLSKGKTVLAIDSDHNMDLTYNLGVTDDSFPYFGTDGTSFLLENFGQNGMNYDTHVYSDLFRQSVHPEFSLSPEDKFTKKYSKQMTDNLKVMSSGPHNDIILHGNRCSHSLSTPLKVYLPFLKLKDDESVVVDMIASSDAAATGIPTGFSFAIVSVEPTIHSVKAARQIMEHLSFFNVPHGYVINKSTNKDEDSDFIKSHLDTEPITVFEFNANMSKPENHLPENFPGQLESIYNHVSSFVSKNGDNRKSLSTEKISRNKTYKDEILSKKKVCC